jgi:chaperonin GroES
MSKIALIAATARRSFPGAAPSRAALAAGTPAGAEANRRSVAPAPAPILNRVSTRAIREPLESVRHRLRPLFDQVVVKELDPERVRRSGLVVPPGTNEPPPQHGIILAVGPGLDWWEQAGVEMPVQPGDHVVFPASAGVWVEIDEERLLVCRVGEVLGVLEELPVEPGA